MVTERSDIQRDTDLIPKEAIEGACKEGYERTERVWRTLQINLPDASTLDYEDFLGRRALGIQSSMGIVQVSPQFDHVYREYDEIIRMLDFQLVTPERYRGFLEAFSAKTQLKAYVPPYWDDVVKVLYGDLYESTYGPRHRDGVMDAKEVVQEVLRYMRFVEENDSYGILDVLEEYNNWQLTVCRELQQLYHESGLYKDEYTLREWLVHLGKPEGNLSLNLYISSEGRLLSASSTRERVYDHPKLEWEPLSTRVQFRNGMISSFWHEEPNGTFFRDPKGPIETIWPYWLQGIDGKRITRDRQSTYTDWQEYLSRVKAGKRVYSASKRGYRRMTEEDALKDLESTRYYTYHSSTQVFYFRKAGRKAGMYRSEMGYKARNEFGSYYVSRNPLSLRTVSVEDTNKMLSAWNPEAYLSLA
jgi:hypothetical protein